MNLTPHAYQGAAPGHPEPRCTYCGLVWSSALHEWWEPIGIPDEDDRDEDQEDDDQEEENPREKGDDDGQEYGDPRDYRDGRE